MFKLAMYQVDAFTSELFRGNPAAVVPLDDWLPDATLQAIAAENNLSETAFIVKPPTALAPAHAGASAHAPLHWGLRWFTPACEVNLSAATRRWRRPGSSRTSSSRICARWPSIPRAACCAWCAGWSS